MKYKIWRYAEKQMTKYNDNPTNFVTELCVGPRYMGNVYPAKDFESAVWVPFEDTEMPVPIGYDHYLSQVFGDYMQLPPEKIRFLTMKQFILTQNIHSKCTKENII